MGRTFFTAILAALFGASAFVRADEPLTAGRVVVLSGLPGDVESDRAYARSRESVLAVLAKMKRENIRLLAHDPARLALPEAWRDAAVAEGSRENFLALGGELGKSAEPLTVVVWGHGGSIRDESVLHVAGPRITATDFATFGGAAAQAGAPVRWLLFFTGSGAVAEKLAALGQPVFASEHTVRFASDPRGLDLALAEWQAAPEATLEELARRAGPRIAAWYEQRSLARTEEPVFFPAKGEPVLLAELESEASDRTAATADGWKDLPRARPEDFPGADAVVLDRSIRYTLGENPAIEAEIEETTQILTAEGKARGDFDLSFSPPQEDLEFTALEVLRPDGAVETFDPDDALDAKSDAPEGYGKSGSKMFSLRGVEPGALLHVRYRRVWRRFPFPHVFLEVPVADDIPVRHLRIAVEAGREETLHARVPDAEAILPRVTETSYGRRHEWTWTNLPAAPAEMLATGGRPRLQISTFPDWASFAHWYLRLIEQADEATDEIEKTARELTAGLDTPREKTRALYEYVAALRYVSIPLGVNSYRPHAAASVLQNRYGDCKDKANLLNTLLRTQGIEANLVLVPRFSHAHEAVPGLAFNHAISRVALPDGPMWLDPTDDVCPFGMLPPGDPGRRVLVVDPASKSLTQLPEPEPGAHRLELKMDFREGATGPARLTGHGFGGYALRAAARQTAAYGGTLSLLQAAGLSPVSGVLSTARETNTPPGEIERPFEWSADVSYAGDLAVAPFVLPAEWKYALQPRTRPLTLNQGYPLAFTQIIQLPPRAVPPAASSEKNGPLEWRLTWEKTDTALTGRLEINLRQPELASEALEQFRAELRRLYTALAR